MTVEFPDMQLPGVRDTDDEFAGFVNYFAFDKTERYTLPDGKQHIEFKPLNEGARVRYEQKTSREVMFNRKSEDAKISVDQGADRHALLMDSVVGWKMASQRPDGQWFWQEFSKGSQNAAFNIWLKNADPSVVNGLHKAIQACNPWMTGDMTAEAIREEINRLQVLLTETEAREAAEKNS